MPTVDLERLIVRQNYFIPIQSSSIMTAIYAELITEDRPMLGLHPWDVVEAHTSSFHFQKNMKYYFIFNHIWGKNWETKEVKAIVEKKSKEFEELGADAFMDQLETMLSHIAIHVYVSIVNRDMNGCTCKVECLPTLYEKLRYFKDYQPRDFEIQDAYLTCKRFIETIFQGGLSATLVSEERKEIPKPSAQLLVNDQSTHQIFDRIKEMLTQATGEVLLCGWIGTLLLPKLKEIKQEGVSIRVITHKANELRGKPGHHDAQLAFKDLISTIDKDSISIRKECHCRVVVVDNKALIGSMDINAISLTGSHKELAIYTEDPEIVRSLRKYFNEIFSPLSEDKSK